MDNFSSYVACFLVIIIDGSSAQWFHKNNQHYFYSQVQFKWGDAQQHCERLGANLVTITSKGENNFLFRKNPSDNPRSGMSAHWIGLKGFCNYGECNWEWKSGERADESDFDWALGYPSTAHSLTYAYLDHISKKWKNSRDEYRSFICETTDGCEPDNPCEDEAICESDRMGGYRCVVANATDSTSNDPCRPNPCARGDCKARGDDYECACPAGYTGSQCGEDIDECLQSTDFTHRTDRKKSKRRGLCVNGSCRNTAGSFSCDCVAGYEGPLCASDIDECVAYASSNICNFGNCTNTVGGFSCICFDGYHGDYCDVEETTPQLGRAVITPDRNSNKSASSNSALPIIIGAVVGGVLLLAVVITVLAVLKRKNILCAKSESPKTTEDGVGGAYAEVPQRDSATTDALKVSV